MQSDLHMLLKVAPLDLGEDDLKEIILESPAGQGRRIDVEAGFTVFEVKRDLRTGHVRADAVTQLAGYVTSRVHQTGQRYVGVLTDGAEWHLYHLVADEMALVSSFTLDARNPQVELFCVWLEGVLATGHQIVPTPREIELRLGADSSAHALDAADLRALYARHRELPTVKLKRQLWAKLLTTALGTSFRNEEELFVEHTLLVMTAEIISHAVVGFDPADSTHSPATLLGGGLFAGAQIGGVVEADFFDWPAEVDGGETLVRAMARRLTRFAWSQVEHDVMKVLYESVISSDQRHRLGEYYTPDWLAEAVVAEAVNDPLHQRVLDPSCGSGTFLFHAVRRYLDAAQAAGLSGPEAIEGVTRSVAGIDVHPVAVTFARVTYLLAIGMERLQADDRPAFSVPVYLGDSVQWGQQHTLLAADDMLTVATDDGAALFANELQFPKRLLTDVGRFDRLIADLADRAAARPAGSAQPSLTAVFRLYAVHPDDQETVARTFATMCELHDAGRDHIWGYYVRNLARPVWQTQAENRVDVLIGNPPWLAYRFMPEATKAEFRAMSDGRGFWAGAAVATHQDLSGLFVARATELYLKAGGKFAFVLPLATLSRRQFAGFRTGAWSTPSDTVHAAFDAAWDLHAVKPSFFPVPACVLFGHRVAEPSPLAVTAQGWSGRLSGRNPSLAEALGSLTRGDGGTAAAGGHASAYATRFAQGASLVPRVLVLVEAAPSGPLGAGAGRRAVRSQRSANEKRPWKDLAPLTGSVERQFVLPVHLGYTVLPFRPLDPQLTVVPWDGQHLLDGNDERLDFYPGLAGWWRMAEQTWVTHRSSSGMSLRDQIDYRRKLRGQLPAASHRVVYSKGGMYMAAAVLTDPTAVIDHTLYWATATSADEAGYLVAILNSATLLELIRPLQARGEHNPRHFDKYVFQAPIPLYDPANQQHAELAELAEAVAGSVELPAVSFQAQRRRIRQALDQDGVAQKIDEAVGRLLAPVRPEAGDHALPLPMP